MRRAGWPAPTPVLRRYREQRDRAKDEGWRHHDDTGLKKSQRADVLAFVTKAQSAARWSQVIQ
jgi:hypothetical protein